MAQKGQKKKPTKARSAKSSSNGSSSNGVMKPSSVHAKQTLIPSILVAFVAFLAGVLTPPSLHVIRHESNGNVSTLENNVSLPYPLPPHTACTPANLDNYLHATPVTGLHLVCVEPMYLDANGDEQPLPPPNDIAEQVRQLEQLSSLQLTFYKGAHASPLKRRVKVRGGSGKGGIQSIDWQDMKMQLYIELGLLAEVKTTQPWAVFTPLGERIVGENDDLAMGDQVGSNKHIMSSIASSGMVVITQGGNWIWPGVREGFQRIIEVSSTRGDGASPDSRNITIETLSLKPLVLSIKGFLSDEECDYIAQKAEPTIQYSGVSLKDADKGKAASNWRTSQSTFLAAQDDQTLIDIEHRTASLTRVPRNHQEYTQVLRYGHSEKYDAHHDYFDPQSYQRDPSTLKLIQNGKKNRFATVFWYLTDVNDGGHTIFPRAFGLPPVRSHSDCSQGLKVQPQKGKVIIFYSLNAAGEMDPLSLHGACPVGEDNVKWAANKWVWNAPMGFIR